VFSFARIHTEGRSVDEDADSDKETGAAINLTGKFKIGSGGDSLSMQLSHGTLGRNMGLFAHSATQGSGDTFDTLDSTGVTLAYQHFGIRLSVPR
jgi:hypothetical protein